MALLLTRWLVAYTYREIKSRGTANLMMIGKATPHWCAMSSSAMQSATFKIGPLGVSTFVLNRALRRLRRGDIRENRHGQNGSGA